MSEIPRADECPPQARPISFGWSQRRVGNTDVIRLSGELDRDMAAEMRGSLLSAAGSSTAGTIVLDLSELAFVDAGGIRLIMKLCGVATSDGRELRVDGLHGMPEKVFDILGFQPGPGPGNRTRRRNGDPAIDDEDGRRARP